MYLRLIFTANSHNKNQEIRRFTLRGVDLPLASEVPAFLELVFRILDCVDSCDVIWPYGQFSN